jgi:hypothetical protein
MCPSSGFSTVDACFASVAPSSETFTITPFVETTCPGVGETIAIFAVEAGRELTDGEGDDVGFDPELHAARARTRPITMALRVRLISPPINRRFR